MGKSLGIIGNVITTFRKQIKMVRIASNNPIHQTITPHLTNI